MAGVYGTPRVPSGVVSRERISAALSTDAPLVVVRAPAGSGKTVAVADWANQLSPETRGVWFTVSDDTTSRISVWEGLLQVMHDAGLLPERGVLEASYPSLESSRDLRRLLVRGFAQMRHDVLLVIDDLHLATDPEIRNDLVALLEATPGLRIVVITRIRGVLEADVVAITLNTQVIETAQLMFTEHETAQLVRNQGLADADGQLAKVLHSAVGGLPLTTRGVLLLMQREGFGLDSATVEERLRAAGADILRDVWTLQVGDDKDIDFVIRCSIPESLNEELATRLTGRGDASAVLNTAEGMGVGMWTESANGPMFTFTPVVRSELRRELHRRFPGEVAELSRTTARWHLERREYYAALRLAVESDDLGLADEAAILGYRGFLRPHTESVREILDPIPLSRLRKSPLLTMLLALSLNASGAHRIRAIELFGLAVASARMLGDKVDPVKRTVLLTIESAALRVMGKPGTALTAAERTVSHYEGLTLAQKDKLADLAPLLFTQTGLSFFYSGRPARALELFRAAYAMPPDKHSAGQVHSLSLTAGVHALNGDLPEAQALVELARSQTWPDGQREGYLGALYQIAEGWLALEAADFDRALSHVTVMEPHLDTIEHWPLFIQLRCLAMLGMGNAPAAATALASTLGRGARPAVTPYVRASLDATRSLLFTASGQLRSAEDALKRHPKRVPQIALQWATLYLTLGKPDLARLVLQPLLDDTFTARQQAQQLLLRAAIALHLGEGELALDTLDRAVTLMTDRRLQLPLRLIPDSDRVALTAAAESAGRSHGLLTDFHGTTLLTHSVLSPVVLTDREHVVLNALVTMSSTAEIAAALYVSVNTVKSQLRSVYKKLGVSSREEALRRAGEQGLLRG